jgi:hypothetical protein
MILETCLSYSSVSHPVGLVLLVEREVSKITAINY